MKKKFVATLCAFALAFTLPMAAFAADDDAAAADGNEAAAAAEDANSEGYTVTEEDGVTTIEVEENTFVKYDPVADEVVNVLDKITVEGAENVTVKDGDDIDWGAYSDEAKEAYDDWYNQVVADKGKELFTIEINADKTADDHAVVMFYLNPDEYGNKVITYYVLHKDGTPQTKTVRVHSDGTVRIWMEDFSIITFMDVDGITKYENMVEPQDGDLLSPKTGC